MKGEPGELLATVRSARASLFAEIPKEALEAAGLRE
jgi:hypothetical protein